MDLSAGVRASCTQHQTPIRVAMRSWLIPSIAAATVVAVIATGIVSSIRSASRAALVLNSYGGPYFQIIDERIIEPFEAETGIEVVYNATGTAAQDYAKIKATNGSPGFDVVVMTAPQALQGCHDGLLEQITPEHVPNLAFLDQSVQRVAGPCGVVIEVQYMALLWRTDKVSAPLDSWQDLFRDELDNRLLLPKFENIMAVYLALMFAQIRGGSIDNVDAGFASLSQLAPSAIAFETSSSRMAAYLKTGRAWATVYWSGRAQLLKDSGVPVEYTIPREGTIPLIVTASIPVGARNKELARKLINFWLEKRSQEAWVEGYSVGSIRTDLDLSPQIRARQITSREDIDRLLLPDFEALARNRTDWNSRWKREVIEASK